MSICPVTLAASDDDWPAQVDFPPQTKRPAEISKSKAGTGQKKPGFFQKLLMGKEPKYDKPMPGGLPDESKPLEIPAKPYPLLRLPRTIQLVDGTYLEPGIYLGASGGGDGHPIGEAPANNQERTLTLLKTNKPQLTVHLKRDGGPDETGQSADAPNPIQKIDPKAPPLVRIEAVPSPDGQTLTFIWKEDNIRFKSEPYPIVIDKRPVLTY